MKYDIHTHNLSAGKHCIFSHSTLKKANSPFSVGIHPWDSAESDFSAVNWTYLLSAKYCVAIGEIGLDRMKGPNLPTQINGFKKQLLLSEQFELPVIIHCVRAFDELILLKRALKPTQPWIVHGFEKIAFTKKLLDEGFFLSIGHRVLTNEKLQVILHEIPLERLFLETDDSGINIEEIYEKVAQLIHLPLNQLEKEIESNIKRVFPKWKIG
jgi:TatD DNase family protein